MGIKPINAGVPMHAWKMDAKPMLSDDDDEFPSLSSCLWQPCIGVVIIW